MRRESSARWYLFLGSGVLLTVQFYLLADITRNNNGSNNGTSRTNNISTSLNTNDDGDHHPSNTTTTTSTKIMIQTTKNMNMTFDQQTEWIRKNFRSADPNEKEWCVKALTEGNYWMHGDYNGGSQFGRRWLHFT